MDLTMKYKIEKVLIIEYSSLPEKIQTKVEKLCGFGNDRYVKFDSDFHYYKNSLKESITLENYNRALEDKPQLDFCIEKFIIDSQIDLTNVDRILFHVCW